MTSTIRSLCPEVKEKLQSTLAISGMAQCVEELILNSLDAGATSVEIEIKPSTWKICIADDGIGMSLEDMRIVGERHNTSKCHSVADLRHPKTFGYRGQALASIKDVCLCLELESRQCFSPNSHIKTFKNGVLCALETLNPTRQKPGTTVTVTDLFYSMPVRRNFASTETEFDMVRRLVESVALIHSGVSFLLLNSETRCRIVDTFGKGSMITTFECLFGSSKAFAFKPFEFKTDLAKFTGYIGTQAASRKRFQFIYVNGRWLPKTRLHKVLHKMLKLSVFLNSDQSHAGNSVFSTDSHGVYIVNVLCALPWTGVSLLKSRSFLESGDFRDLADHLQRGILEFLSREKLLDSLSVACLLQNVPREDGTGLQDDGGKRGEKQGSEFTARVDNSHSISTVDLKHNQQSKLIHRLVMRKSPRSGCLTIPSVVPSSNSKHLNKFKPFAAGNHSLHLAQDGRFTGEEFFQMQERKCLENKSQFHSKSFEHSVVESEHGKISTSLSQHNVQLQIHEQEKAVLRSEHLALEKTTSFTAENLLRFNFDMDSAGKAAGLTNSIAEKKTDFYFLQEPLVKFHGNSVIEAPTVPSAVDFHNSGNSCRVQKRAFPFEENATNDNSSDLLKSTSKGNITKRMNLELAKVTNRSDISLVCDSQFRDHRVPQKGRLQSYSAADRFRNADYLKDWMGSQVQLLCQGKSSMVSDDTGNLSVSVDRCVVDTSKVEGLLGMRMSSCVMTEHTSVSYYYSERDCLVSRNVLPTRGRMEAWKENDFTQIRALTSAAERLEQRQKLRLRKHSDLQLDGLSRHPVRFHDWKQIGNTLPDIIDLRRSGNELNLLDSLQLTNSSISNMKVICQVDRKFIAGWIKKSTNPVSDTGSELLVFVDQHAADERIRLEQLSKEAVEMDSRGTFRVGRSVIRPSLMLCLDLDIVQAMDKFQEFFANNGLTYSIDRQQMGRLWLRAVPTCFLMHSASSSTSSRNTIKYLAQKLIHELIQEIEETNFVQPATAVLPKLLHNILCSQACHGAIKFGDALGREKCETLRQRLSQCRLPFQCAHGRPTMVPIADLTHIRKSFPLKKVTRPRLWKLKSRTVNE